MFTVSDTEPSLNGNTVPSDSSCLVPSNPLVAVKKSSKKKQNSEATDKSSSDEAAADTLCRKFNKKRHFLAQHFFTLSLLDFVCHLKAKNEFESEYMFKGK